MQALSRGSVTGCESGMKFLIEFHHYVQWQMKLRPKPSYKKLNDYPNSTLNSYALLHYLVKGVNNGSLIELPIGKLFFKGSSMAVIIHSGPGY